MDQRTDRCGRGNSSGVNILGLVRNSLIALLCVFTFSSITRAAHTAEELDLVIAGGRVIDPSSGLDAIRTVGIRGDEIVVLSTGPLVGKRTIDATGLVVAPGFIDLHTHSPNPIPNLPPVNKVIPSLRHVRRAPLQTQTTTVSKSFYALPTWGGKEALVS